MLAVGADGGSLKIFSLSYRSSFFLGNCSIWTEIPNNQSVSGKLFPLRVDPVQESKQGFSDKDSIAVYPLTLC